MKIMIQSAHYFRKSGLVILVSGMSLVSASLSYAQSSGNKTIVYPSRGQSSAVQASDTAACNAWAQTQTGFDPVAALKAQQDDAEDARARARAIDYRRSRVGGEAIGGAARGAVAGGVIGAIAGDAERGAAIGASAGAYHGRVRNRAKHRALFIAEARARDAGAQREALNNRRLADFEKAVFACMEGRGYIF